MNSRLLSTARCVVFNPLALAELFLIGNISFLAVDVYIAHAANSFADSGEWIPVGFSVAGAVMLFVAALVAGSVRPPLSPWAASDPARCQWVAWTLGVTVGAGAIAVGVSGLIYHLLSGFFQQQTLRNLVYAAPFAAPLSYAGLGLLAILNRTVPAESKEWARWVVFLALGGFLGNFILSLADHAQNGFFDGREWIAVVASAFAVGALLAAIVDYRHRSFLWLCAGLQFIEIAVGLLGWYYHVHAILNSAMTTAWDKVIYSAPVFAPLLFADLAILGLLGLWALLRPEASLSAFDARDLQRAVQRLVYRAGQTDHNQGLLGVKEDKQSKFYVRTGSGTREMDLQEAVGFIKTKWG